MRKEIIKCNYNTSKKNVKPMVFTPPGPPPHDWAPAAYFGYNELILDTIVIYWIQSQDLRYKALISDTACIYQIQYRRCIVAAWI